MDKTLESLTKNERSHRRINREESEGDENEHTTRVLSHDGKWHQLASIPGKDAYSYALNLMDILFSKQELSQSRFSTLIKEKNRF